MLIPEVGQVVQLNLGGHILEAPILARATSDQKTFRIVVTDPFSESNIILELTPSAPGISDIDDCSGKKPYWQFVINGPITTYLPAKLFFLN